MLYSVAVIDFEWIKAVPVLKGVLSFSFDHFANVHPDFDPFFGLKL